MNPVQLKFNSFNPIKEQFGFINNVTTKLQECIQKEKKQRSSRFAFIAFCIMLINATIDFLRNMPASGILIMSMAFIMFLLIIFSVSGFKKFIVPAIVLTINAFLLAISFAEGLKSGSYMQILALLFTLSYLSADKHVTKLQGAVYFFITACCFCTCIIFCKQTNAWQHINDALYHQIYIFNCVSAVLICGIFAGVNTHTEKLYKFKYADEKIKAQILQTTLNEQNMHLQEIAYTSSHVIRKPLANIIALTEILNNELNSNLQVTHIINHLDISSKCLDEAIKEIVLKTKHDNVNPETFLKK